MLRSVFTLIGLLSLLFFTGTYAQIRLESSDIQVEMIPPNPGPNESVDVTINSYVFNINTANIVWMVNGRAIKSGKGERNFTFRVGDTGSVTTLKVMVQTPDGQELEDVFTISPMGVDLMWQSEGYTPPFYKGKGMFSFQNKITFIAVPHTIGSSGVEVSPKTLVYKWSKDGKVNESASGYGKNTFTVEQGVIARPMNVSVTASTASGSMTGFARIDVAPTDPQVFFYNKSPVYGIEFQKTLEGEINLDQLNEMNVVVIPYFFGTLNPDELVFNWSINGMLIESNKYSYQMSRVFRKPEGTSGLSQISISIEHPNKILQLANRSFSLKFDSEQ